MSSTTIDIIRYNQKFHSLQENDDDDDDDDDLADLDDLDDVTEVFDFFNDNINDDHIDDNGSDSDDHDHDDDDDDDDSEFDDDVRFFLAHSSDSSDDETYSAMSE